MAGILHQQINLRRTAPGTYNVDWHQDWTVASVLHGGAVAAIIHHAAVTHLTTDPKLAAQSQPDILNLHIEFLRSCEKLESTITVTPLKLGAAVSTLQLQLSQNGQTKALALATSTNFDKVLGPSAPTAWAPLPPPDPKPDFDRILANKPDDNWIPVRVEGELIPMTSRVLALDPRAGFRTDGIVDNWNGFVGDERMDATYIALMTDMIPSMSDTLMRNGGLYDAHRFWEKAKQWADANPGVTAVFENSLKEVMQSATFNATVTLDMEFKRRLPKEGLRFVFMRTATKRLQDGRMDVDITICDEDMELVCDAHQLILVVEAQRKFRGGQKSRQKL
ncbi:thioesterase family protein [Diaporthe sp. PMI_573]|nr:thioesterase family protein [Diaporthaceae sp. PMI_573]